MSYTDIKREEWKDLLPVPPEMYSHWNQKEERWMPNTLGLCDGNKLHGQAHYFWQTKDHRALALCGQCEAERQAQIGGK